MVISPLKIGHLQAHHGERCDERVAQHMFPLHQRLAQALRPARCERNPAAFAQGSPGAEIVGPWRRYSRPPRSSVRRYAFKNPRSRLAGGYSQSLAASRGTPAKINTATRANQKVGTEMPATTKASGEVVPFGVVVNRCQHARGHGDDDRHDQAANHQGTWLGPGAEESLPRLRSGA